MNKNILIVIAILIIILGAITFYFQHLYQNNQPVENSNTQTIGTTKIIIQNFSFNPSAVTINKGETVTWINQDPMPHKISGSIFGSNALENSQSYSFTFNDTGTFDYICSIHPSMKGEIIVK